MKCFSKHNAYLFLYNPEADSCAVTRMREFFITNHMNLLSPLGFFGKTEKQQNIDSFIYSPDFYM